jgi:HK97 family phage major capsid protein
MDIDDPMFEIESRRSDPLAHEDPVNTRNGTHRYSLMKAVRDMARGGQLTGIEKEVSDQLEERSGTPSGWFGFKMPHRDQTLTFRDIDKQRKVAELRSKGLVKGQRGSNELVHILARLTDLVERRGAMEYRNLSTAAGAGSIPTILERDWIELLRNAMKVKQAGAREIMDLKGKFAIPRQNAAATSYWVAEAGAPTASNQTLDQVLFVPHTIGAFTDINRRFFELTILDSGEEFVKEDLTAILGRGIDLAALNGPGGLNQPLGIMQNTGITSTRTVALGTNGAAPTWAPMVELLTIVMRGNAADLGEFVYITNADVYGTLATTAKIGSTFPVFLLDDAGNPAGATMYAKRVLQTQQLPNNLTKGTTNGTLSPIIGGIWNQLILAYWSGVDILVDPYTGSSTGTIRIVALQDMDIQVRHNEAFSVCVDMVTNQSQ